VTSAASPAGQNSSPRIQRQPPHVLPRWYVGASLRRETADRLDRALGGKRCNTLAVLLCPLLYACERRADPFGRPASDLRFHWSG